MTESQVAEQPALKVSVEDIGPARKAMTIEIPADRIENTLKGSLEKLQTDVQLPGFRRGRAPMRLIEKRFGQANRDEVRNQLLSECYTQAIEQEKLSVIGEPEIKDIQNIQLPDSGSLTFRAEVEITPKVELPELDGVAVNKPKITVGETEINAELERLRERFGQMTPVENATVTAGDYVQAEVKVLPGLDAADTTEPIVNVPGSYILVNGADRQYKGHVAGIVVEDLGKQLESKKVGDVVRISMTGPTGHEEEKIKGQPITIVIDIKKIERVELATLESLPAHVGMPDVEEMKKRLQEMLEERRDQQQKAAMHQQLSDMLLEKVTLELPEGLSKRQTARLLHRAAMDMLYRGVPESDIQQKLAEMRTGSEQQARQQLKLFFILSELSQKLAIEVSEAEINGVIAMMAMQQGRRPEKLRQELQRSGQIEQVFLQVRDAKTLDKVLEKATVTEVEPEAKK